jgi:hypothetical protein
MAQSQELQTLRGTVDSRPILAILAAIVVISAVMLLALVGSVLLIGFN